MKYIIDSLAWIACFVYIIFFAIGCASDFKWEIYEIKCYSKGVVIFDETLTGNYHHSDRGFSFFAIDGSYYVVKGECVAKRIGRVSREEIKNGFKE